MFWSSRKNKNLQRRAGDTLYELASKLGVENRLSERINYPEGCKLTPLPEIYFAGKPITVKNISVGGCCLIDPTGCLGLDVGAPIELTLSWQKSPTDAKTPESVPAKIVSLVEPRYHIQFLSLSPERKEQLRQAMIPGSRGRCVRSHYQATSLGPNVEAAELWSSPNGDCIVLENDIHRIGNITYMDEVFLLFRDAWPRTKENLPCTKSQFENLLLFLCNVHAPSPRLAALIEVLCAFESGVAP